MIYTVGHKENYLKAIAESEDGYIEKTGRCSGYQGGIVFPTYSSAVRWLYTNPHPTWCVFGLDADWENDTELTRDGWWHDLIKDSRIIVLSEELENDTT